MIAIEVIRPIGTDRGKREVDFRAELAHGILQAKAKWVGTIPVYEEQVVAPIAIDVENLDGLDGARVRELGRLAQGFIGILPEPINTVFAQEHEINATIAIEIAEGQGIGSELAIVNGPAFWRTPIIASLAVL